jgi:hypothetical protein
LRCDETLKEKTRKPPIIGLTAIIILALVISYYCPPSQAQTQQNFTTSDKFIIPDFNGTISFAVNGSYSEATLNNNTWTFKDLTLNNQSIPGFGLNDFSSVGNLMFSTQNSNVTILAYITLNASFPVNLLSYTMEGKGKQMVNLELDTSIPTSADEWSVIVPNNVVLAEGQGWTLLPDNTVVIASSASYITVAHFGIITTTKSNLPFYLQHSVALTTAAVLIIVAALAIIIRTKMIKNNFKDKGNREH